MKEMIMERRCEIDQVFARPFIELISLAPRNPVVRGLILAQTGRLPASDCDTFESVKQWVETTCERKVQPTHIVRGAAGDGITVKVEFSETEYGRVHYSVPRSGTDEFALDADELLELVRKVINEGGSLDAVVEKIAELIHEDAWSRCEPDLEDAGDYAYEDFDSSGSENAEIEFASSQIQERLLAFLQLDHPELLEALA
jgi:hypothetical protein